MNLVLSALGGYFIAQVGKTISPWKIPSWLKMALALFGSMGVSAAFDHRHFLHLVAFSLAGAGLAVLMHRVARVLSLLGDGLVTGIMQTYRKR